MNHQYCRTIHRGIIAVWSGVSQSLRAACVLAALMLSVVAQGEEASQASDQQMEAPVPEPASPETGEGLTLGDTGIPLGGYATVSVADLYGEPSRAALDSLSLFLSWEGPTRWSAFAEMELENALILQRGDSTTDEAHVDLERLHLDYAASDAVKVRIGKFLTPVGRWNLIHAAPLTWTTSRPLITEATFPTNATGAMLYGSIAALGQPLDYYLYASPGEELLPDPDIDTFKEAYGARIAYGLGATAQIGFSYVNFEQEDEPDEHKTLWGLDFLWTLGRVELTGEWARRTRNAGGASGDERGLYVQAVAPIAGRLYGVLRYESFEPADAGDGLHLYLGGLTYRWSKSLVLKGEFREAVENAIGAPEGFLASAAVLF